MNLKLNTESMAGQMLMSAAGGQATGKNGEDFEQMLLQMSAVQDDLVAGGDSQAAKPKPQVAQRPQAAQKPQSQQKPQGSQKAEAAQKPQAGNDTQSVQNGQPGQDDQEQPILQELAAMLGMQPVILNFDQMQVAAETEAQTGNGVLAEVALQQGLAEYQVANPQDLQQAGGEMLDQMAQAEQPELTEQLSVLRQFAPVAEAENPQSGQQADLAAMPQGMTGEATEDEPEAEALAADSQLFGEAAATPVKVAEVKQPEATVQPEMTNAAEQISQQIQQAMQAGDSTVRINLNPASLGSLTVEIARLSDGTLSVLLSTVTEKAANLLSKHSAGLQSLLMNQTQGPVKVEVENRMDDQTSGQQFLNPEGQNNPKEQHQQRQQQQQAAQPEDFLQQLRLGLISLEQAV